MLSDGAGARFAPAPLRLLRRQLARHIAVRLGQNPPRLAFGGLIKNLSLIVRALASNVMTGTELEPVLTGDLDQSDCPHEGMCS
jgi:hypothetical protein